MTVKKLTPVLFAKEIEPCVAFWVDRLGFEKTAEVPEGDKLAFAMLQKGGVELMYQSYASAEKDVRDARIAELVRKGPTFLFVEVDDLDATIAATKGTPVIVPKRTTFYGSIEIGVQDPAGHVVTFAQFGAPSNA
ncbi:MAG TPA: VOC family protein [Bryobacteraceae bacterium]|nr:VOC family protein [Bryobacteraceae bacterium]